MITNCTMHTYAPQDYASAFEWAERKLKTHDQFKCDECGLYLIWIRKQNA